MSHRATGADVGQRLLERGELGVADRAPRPPVERQDDGALAEPVVEGDRRSVGVGQTEGGRVLADGDPGNGAVAAEAFDHHRHERRQVGFGLLLVGHVASLVAVRMK